MEVILFGANNPTGAAFLSLYKHNNIETWGRRPGKDLSISHTYCDLSEQAPKPSKPLSGILVSFAPVWLLAQFINYIAVHESKSLRDLRGIVACSSSSYKTKRYAFNEYDKSLSYQLHESHNVLKTISSDLKIPCQIIAPTLVYGNVGEFSDKNLSKIKFLMRLLPFIILPKNTGLRQPIHASQLALVAKHQVDIMMSGQYSTSGGDVLCVGGDSYLTYKDMIVAIKNTASKLERKCLIITIPNRFFLFLAAPLILLSPKLFEAIMRIQSNLSGFTKAHEVLQVPPRIFPILLPTSNMIEEG